MIKQKQLEELGYSIHNKLVNNSVDFIHEEEDFEIKRVNLNDGIIQIIEPLSSHKTEKMFTEIEDFIEYLNTQQNL